MTEYSTGLGEKIVDYSGLERQLGPKVEVVDQTPQPLQDYIVFQPDVQRVTEGGVILPESAKQPYARVVAVGPGCYMDGGPFKPADHIKPGDRILIDAPGGEVSGFEWLGERYHMARARYVACVLPGDVKNPSILKVPELRLQ